MASILEIKNVSKNFGGIRAVRNCSLKIERGKISGLIGPNGAGKTTLFNLITGFYEVDFGEVLFKGEKVQPGSQTHEIFLKGIYRSFQITREFHQITVLENLLAVPPEQDGEKIWMNWFRPDRVRKQENRNIEKALDILKFLELDKKAAEYAGNLAGGERKLLELGRMMMVEPELVLLDEPEAGVPPAMQGKINEYIKTISREREITFFIVEHDMNVIMKLCNPIIVMVDGAYLTEGTPEKVQHDEKVVDAYLGR